jgi:tetratricopeptide (TPR) repeat protein
MFYAQALLLVHYLSLGRPERNFQADMTVYLSALREGTPDPEAFELAFDFKVARLNRTLRKYGGSMKARIVPSEMFEPDYTPRVRTLTKPQAAERLAHAALSDDAFNISKPLVEYALAEDPGSSLAWANSGRLHAREKEYEAAFANIEKAIQLDPKNPYPLIDMADLIVAQAQSLSEPAKERRAKLALAAQFCLRAWRLDPSIPEVYATYGQVLLEDGQRPEKALEMLKEASLLLPGRPGVRFLLAQALYAADQHLRAMKEAKSILKTVHLSQGLATEVEEILAGWQEAEDQAAPAQVVVDASPN